QLRSDIEVLAAAGMIDGITTQWPLPWASIVQRLKQRGADSSDDPEIRAAAERVLSQAGVDRQIGTLIASGTIDATNAPSVIRGFDAMGRQEVQGAASLDYMSSTTALRLSVGAQTH